VGEGGPNGLGKSLSPLVWQQKKPKFCEKKGKLEHRDRIVRRGEGTQIFFSIGLADTSRDGWCGYSRTVPPSRGGIRSGKRVIGLSQWQMEDGLKIGALQELRRDTGEERHGFRAPNLLLEIRKGGGRGDLTGGSDF